MKKYLLIVGAIFFASLVLAQKPPVKFGKMDDELVKMTSHPLDPDADAIVLMDYGTTNFDYVNLKHEGFIYDFEKTIVIKILSKDGLKYGDFKIPYYHNNFVEEEIIGLKGNTYNYIDGKIVKTKLENSSIYNEEELKNWSRRKVSMPDVKVGSVVELTYTKISPFIWNLVTWTFQDYIPTVHSEYRIKIPQYFDYQQLHSGYHPLAIADKTSSAGTIEVRKRVKENQFYGARTELLTQKYNFTASDYRWIATNVPAFKPEAYTASTVDYISKIEFELRGTQYPNEAYKQHMGTWKSLTRSYLEHPDFKWAIKQTDYMRDELATIKIFEDDIEKIGAFVGMVKNQIEWDNRFRTFATNNSGKTWRDKTGSSADINLILVAGLRKLGFNSDPVLISTRKNGRVREQYAISNQFNSVIAIVEVEGKQLLLDATDRFLPVGVLPKACLNGKGWRVSESHPQWITLKPTAKQEEKTQALLNIDTEGIVSGNLEITETGYNGYISNKDLSLSGEENFFEVFQEEKTEWIIDEYEYDESGKISEPFVSKYQIEINDHVLTTGDKMYFDPTLGEVINENPFKIDNREYPVDYAYPIRKSYLFRYSIPENFEIADLPQSEAFALPNKGGIFRYSVAKSGNDFQLTIVFQINQTLFTQMEYPVLKQFYHKVVEKCREQVILEKQIEP
ncbi:MAG: DUF3857 domain-containing protein [Bacteroidota bacterium]